jgi:hypothetical protein
MKKFFIISILFILCLVELSAQRRGLILRPRSSGSNGPSYRYHNSSGSETFTGDFPGAISFSIALGPSFLNGDMDGTLSRSLSLNGNYMANIAVTHIFPANIGYKLSYTFGSYLQSDIGSLKGLDYRNYSINTTLSEFGIQGQYYLLGGPYSDDMQHSFYISAGIGVILNSSIPTPNSSPIESSIYLKSLLTLDIPVTIGYKYDIGNNMQIGAEFAEHFALADYVDGLKPRVGNYANDVLSHFALTFTYNFYKKTE